MTYNSLRIVLDLVRSQNSGVNYALLSLLLFHFITINIYTTMREFVRLRLSKQDKEFLQLEATKNRMSLSSYVRTRVLNNTIDKNGEL